MPFTLLPAVDVADGRAARGVAADTDPLQLALGWQSAGAMWVHLADLDAAFGCGSNAPLLAAVISELDTSVQLSGGIHDAASLQQALSTGCGRVVLATASLGDLDWVTSAIAAHGERVAVGLDVRVVGGPTARHRLVDRGDGIDRGDLWDAIEHLDAVGCARYVVTDVDRDGSLRGAGVELCRAVVESTTTPVIASGGIASLDDLVVLARTAGVDGAVVGSALHAGRFTFADAAAAVAQASDGSSQ